ncbi:MAG: response regulator [Candidatus Obscuribacterales bacterium]|nr:response regulator [Candidatus Obscuribacterales bacterium]
MKISKILMVDDDMHIRRIAEISLKRVGKWDVRLASSGKEALLLVKEDLPDLILLDVSMPELDGPAIFAILKEDQSTASVPVIFLTGRVLHDEVEEYRKLGVAGVINKPFDPLKLPGEIMRLLEAE